MTVDRNALDFNFVSIVLSVTGRVRPDDLQSIPEIERASLLHAYADAYGATRPLHFEGDILVAGPGDPLPAPPVADPYAGVDVPAAPATPEALPDADYTAATAVPAAPLGGFAPASAAPERPADPAPAAGMPPSAGAAPLPAADGAFFGMPEADEVTTPVTFDLAAGAVAGDTPGAFAAPAPDAAAEDAQPKVSWLFWLLPILFTWLGGLVAYFAVKPKNPKQAKAMLITGLVLPVLYAAVGAAAYFAPLLLVGR